MQGYFKALMTSYCFLCSAMVVILFFLAFILSIQVCFYDEFINNCYALVRLDCLHLYSYCIFIHIFICIDIFILILYFDTRCSGKSRDKNRSRDE